MTGLQYLIHAKLRQAVEADPNQAPFGFSFEEAAAWHAGRTSILRWFLEMIVSNTQGLTAYLQRPVDDTARNGEWWLIKTRWWGWREARWDDACGWWFDKMDEGAPQCENDGAFIVPDWYVTAYAPLPGTGQ